MALECQQPAPNFLMYRLFDAQEPNKHDVLLDTLLIHFIYFGGSSAFGSLFIV